MTQQNQEVIQQWSGVAPYWEKHRDCIREMFAPVTQALIEDARITSGSAALDVATGPGEPSLTIAGIVGSRGKVVGTDAVPEMVAAGQREATRRGLENIHFQAAFAESMPFPDGTFDAVVSRFGIMFFPSPVDAIREWLRVLKPGGRLSLAAWHYPQKNPFFCTVTQVVDRYAAPSPPASETGDAFRFAEPGKLRAVLEGAGVAISDRLLKFPIRVSLPVEDFWTLRYEMSDTLRARLAGLPAQKMAELKRDVIETMRAFASDGTLVFSGEVWIVSGEKPR